MDKKDITPKLNVLFFATSKKDSTLFFDLYEHTKGYYKHIYKPIFKRITSFFILEWLFALQRNLPKDVVNEISEYSYRKYVAQNQDGFFTRLFFNILGKMYFIKCYNILQKYNIEILYIYDDNTIINKACIIAAHNLKIDVKILHDGYKKNLIFIDENATRWNNSLPRNVSFYEEIQPSKTYIQKMEAKKENLVLVLLQDDLSPETLLYSPWVRNQKHLLRILADLSKKVPQTQFVVFNATMEYHDTPTIHFTKKPLQEFLPFCKCVITINNQKALFALEVLKPVITLGNAFFNIKGITIGVSSEEKLHTSLKNIDSFKLNTTLVNNFLYCINELYSIKCENINIATTEEKHSFVRLIA
jgi:hypothetical protein